MTSRQRVNLPRLAVFASGNGSNFEAIVRAYKNKHLYANPIVCICDNEKAPAIERAANLDLPVTIFRPKDFSDKCSFESAILQCLDSYNIDIICLAGYMRIVGRTILEAYPGRILNIHPSLLPLYKGKNAIRRAFDDKRAEYGVTVHVVDVTLDGGEIICQEKLVYEGSNYEELESKVHNLEHKLYPKAINKFLEEKWANQF